MKPALRCTLLVQSRPSAGRRTTTAPLRLLAVSIVLGLCTGLPYLAQGSNFVATDKVPADFPKDVPVYDGARVRSYGPILPSNPKLGNVLVLDTGDSKRTVLDFYQKVLLPAGWQVETFAGAPDSLAASKGSRRISVNVTESRSDKKSSTIIYIGLNEME